MCLPLYRVWAPQFRCHVPLLLEAISLAGHVRFYNRLISNDPTQWPPLLFDGVLKHHQSLHQCFGPGWTPGDNILNNIGYTPAMWIVLHQIAERHGVGDQFRVHYDPSHSVLMGQDTRSMFQYLKDEGYSFIIGGMHVNAETPTACFGLQAVLDSVMGESSDSDWVDASRSTVIGFLCDKAVFEISRGHSLGGHSTNLGTVQNPIVRSRLVATDFKPTSYRDRPDLFVATPPAYASTYGSGNTMHFFYLSARMQLI